MSTPSRPSPNSITMDTRPMPRRHLTRPLGLTASLIAATRFLGDTPDDTALRHGRRSLDYQTSKSS